MGARRYAAAAIVVVLSGAGIWAAQDYRGWLALGKGGLPPTPKGWLTMTRLRFAAKKAGALDVYDVEPDDKLSVPITNLADRRGPRPKMAAWPIPHRQLDQFISAEMQSRLSDLFDRIVNANDKELYYKMSFYEKHSPAITLRRVDRDHPHAVLAEGEVAHIHPGDGSMHMIFSPIDAREIIARGWGERHPLAGVMAALPTTYLYIYPPRNEDELQAIDRILQASAMHMTSRANLN